MLVDDCTISKCVNCGVSYLVRRICVDLGMAAPATCTALHFMHKIFDYQAEFSKTDVAVACIILAGKTCECAQRLREVHNISRYIQKGKADELTMQQYWERRSVLVDLELRLVRILAFDLEPSKHHIILLNFGKCLSLSKQALNVAWCLLNDSFLCSLCIEISPPLLALISLFNGCKMLSVGDLSREYFNVKIATALIYKKGQNNNF
eukprot:GHVL01005964.1.p1 GENE.GHVL01005964.1~~GHVL01005964.1.p1  ORF type:complete len:207 (+),score=17.52 GHVL01005964.1:142-762(+)